MKYRAIPIYLMLASIGWAAHAQESETELSEDDRIVVAVDSLTRGETLPANMSLARPLGEHRAIVVVYLKLVSVKSGYVGIPTSPPRGILFDSDGVEYELETLSANLTGGSRMDPMEIVEGAYVRLFFVAPKASILATLRWFYQHWDSPESEEVQTAEIDIDLAAKD